MLLHCESLEPVCLRWVIFDQIDGVYAPAHFRFAGF
jgi:hypothetical protein